MANDLSALTPKLLAQGLMALRDNCVMPRLVNRDYDIMAAQKGSTIDIPIPPAIAVQDVSPGATPPSTADTTPTSVAVPLDQWKEAPFYLTDKDMLQAMNGVIPMQASAAIAGLATSIDSYILGLYKRVYGYVGTAGTTPFTPGGATDVNGTTAFATQAGKILNEQLAPMQNRRFVINPAAEAKALELPAFTNVSFSGSTFGIVDAQLNRKLGFDWFMDQNVKTHTNTGGAGFLLNNASDETIGAKTAIVDTGSTAPAEGDIFTVAGDTQTYVITAATTTLFTFEPAAKVAWANNAAFTFKASHVVNLAFQRDAIAFATRPLEDTNMGLGGVVQSAVDPISGLTLRLEITREHKRTRFSYDILFGGALVRPELACRGAG